MKDEIFLAIGQESRRIDEIMTTIQTLTTRIDTFERTNQPDPAEHGVGTMITDNGDVSQAHGQARPVYRNRQGYTDDSDISIIALGVPAQQGENLIEIPRKIIEALGEEVSSNVTITKTFRFRSRYNDRPPPMKITFRNLNEKILVLRNKMNLKDTNDYAKVYLKGCKNHAEY